MKSMNTRKLLAALCLVLCLTVTAALPPSLVPQVTAQAAAKVVKLNMTKADLFNGKTLQLKLVNAKGTVTWKSSDKKIASVTSKGKVKGLKPGKATITATNAGKKYTCKVTVKSVLAVKKTSVTINTGNQTALDFWFYVDGEFYWKVANPKLLMCSWSEKWTDGGDHAKLYLTGLKAGTTTVTLTNNQTKDTVVIKVKVKGKTVSPITASKENIEMEVGDLVTINITSLDGSGMTLDISDEDVVDCEWGDWVGDVSPLAIYGKEGGDAILTIAHDDTGATVKVKVSVDDPFVYD